MKIKLITYLLLLSFTVPAVSIFCCLKYRKSIVKHEVKQKLIAGLEKNQLILLKFSLKEAVEQLEWEHSREFEYSDAMYDVVERTATSDSVTFLCWPDNKETKLNKQLAMLLMHALDVDPITKNQQQVLNKILKTLYYTKIDGLKINIEEFNPPFFPARDFLTMQYKTTPPVPPPWNS